ncbi:MAG: M64 family metallopeptidase, partial [Deltaproteobacteria bacterium]|nr:M64 family metallopeptidase [Deltaproteobacteria bacterium]
RADEDGNPSILWCKNDDLCASLVVGSGNTAANVDIVLVADGFAEGDMGLFRDKARLFAERLRAVKDYGDYFHRFNIWIIDRPVDESGDSRYDVDVKEGGGYPEIPDSHRFSWLGFDGGLERIYNDTSYLDPDVIGVVFNTAGHGGYGRASQWADGATPIFTVGVSDDTAHATVPHELGHALFALGDEYAGDRCGKKKDYPNISKDLDDLPWADMVNTSVPTVEGHEYPCTDDTVEDGDNCPGGARDIFESAYISEHDGQVGAYEGGASCDTDYHRPSLHCMMGAHYGGFTGPDGDEYRDPSGEVAGSKFCPVCRREMDRYFENIENSLGDSCPETWRDDGFCDGCLGDDPDCCGLLDYSCWAERWVAQLLCGDGVCSGDENSQTCAADCAEECGDGVCNYDEDPDSCAEDCGCAAIDSDQFEVCESIAPYGCWCDPGCVASGDCCADADDVCGYEL